MTTINDLKKAHGWTDEQAGVGKPAKESGEPVEEKKPKTGKPK
jgi:hypothetical protein